MTIPATPGPLTLVFVKWIPGEHSPSGQITNLVGLKLSVAGKPLAWRRDDVDMFAFHCQVPAGETAVEASFEYLSPTQAFDYQGGVSATANLAIINWNQVLLYPKVANTDDLTFAAELRLPEGWQYGTALPVERSEGELVRFLPVSLTTLVDSPVIAGAYYRRIELTPGQSPPHYVDMVADSAAALDLAPETVAHFTRLVAEAGRLFGARHYRSYHFLVTLSDPVAHIAQEHHESSDDRLHEREFLDPHWLAVDGDVLPHEFAHSWNGKYRRPAGIATSNFQEPMHGEMLWAYEGLTEYLGKLLATRSGFWTEEQYRENLALDAAMLDHRAGRTWRPLEDTAVAAQLLYFAPETWAARRRGTDFYPEGDLIWLEADALIRRESGGRRSLDDFCRLFHGGGSGPPIVKAYTFEDLTAALKQIQPYDWTAFFRARLTSTEAHAPVGGIEAAGWQPFYTEVNPGMLRAKEETQGIMDLSYSLGLTLETSGAESGSIRDVIPGTPAALAGIGPGMKLAAVNGRRWSPAVLREALRAAKSSPQAIELLVENGGFFKTYRVAYHDGERFPHLERDPARPDLLEKILQPLVPLPPA